MIARIVGSHGDNINALKAEMGSSFLAVRGEGLDTNPNREMLSRRVHFVIKCPFEAEAGVRPALERALAKIHADISAKLSDPEYIKKARTRSPHQKSGGRQHSSGPVAPGPVDRTRPIPHAPPAPAFHNIIDLNRDTRPWRPPGSGPPFLPPPLSARPPWFQQPPPAGWPPLHPAMMRPPWPPPQWVGRPPPMGHFGAPREDVRPSSGVSPREDFQEGTGMQLASEDGQEEEEEIPES